MRRNCLLHPRSRLAILFITIVYIIINHNNIMFQHVSLAKVFGNITPTTSITESIILKNRKYCHLAILQPQDINYHAHFFSDAGKREKRASHGH